MPKDQDADRPLRRDAERNRRLIIATAKEAFAEHGLHVTLDDIAARAGLGVGTVYRKFPNRRALVGALFEDRIAEVAELAERAAAEGRPPWPAFVELITELAALHAEDRGLREVLLDDDRAAEQFAAALRQLRRPFSAVIERARADGALRADFAVQDLPVLMAMISAAADRTGADWRRTLTWLIDGLHTEGVER